MHAKTVTEPADPPQDRLGALTRYRLALLATCLLAAIIAWLTLTPNPPIPNLDIPFSDKFFHVIAFAALILPTAMLYARNLFWILPLTILFGGTIEIVQPYIGREAEAGDILANLLGLALGMVMGLVFRAWACRHA